MFYYLMNLLAAAAPAEESAQLVFNPANFIANLQHMGMGMLVIFIVIGVIILSTKLINFLFSDGSDS